MVPEKVRNARHSLVIRVEGLTHGHIHPAALPDLD